MKKTKFKKMSFSFIMFSLVSLYASFEFSGVKNVGCRVASLGSAYTAVAEDIEGAYLNPAGLTQNKVYNIVSLMYSELFNLPELSYSYLGFATPDNKGKGCFGLNISILGLSSFYSERQFILSYARKIIKQKSSIFSLGVSLKLLQRVYEDKVDYTSLIFDQNGNPVLPQEKIFVDVNYGIDIGGLYSVKIEENLLRIGGSFRTNFVDETNINNIRVGLSYNLAKKTLISFDYDISENSYSLGAEYSLVYRLLDARAGYEQTYSGSNISLGIGLILKTWRFDFAYTLSRTGLPDTYKIGLLAKF